MIVKILKSKHKEKSSSFRSTHIRWMAEFTIDYGRQMQITWHFKTMGKSFWSSTKHNIPHSEITFNNEGEIKISEMQKLRELVANKQEPQGILDMIFSAWMRMIPDRNAGMSSMSVQFSSVQSLSRVRLFATPWIAACQ